MRLVSADVNRSIGGYVLGNLAISVIAGATVGISLWILGVPYAAALAVFMGVCDLVPLVGATVGALAAIGVAFAAQGVTAGIVMIVVNVVYQQFENHILQPIVYRKTVQLSAFLVLVAVLIGGELMGVLGALVAIPIAGSIQLVVRELRQGAGDRYRHRPNRVSRRSSRAPPGSAGCGLAHELPDRVHVLGRRRHVPDRHADGVAAAQVGVRDERPAVGVHAVDDGGVQARAARPRRRRPADGGGSRPSRTGPARAAPSRARPRSPPRGAGRARCGPAMSAARPSAP